MRHVKPAYFIYLERNTQFWLNPKLLFTVIQKLCVTGFSYLKEEILGLRSPVEAEMLVGPNVDGPVVVGHRVRQLRVPVRVHHL